jgi:hypothetical protein
VESIHEFAFPDLSRALRLAFSIMPASITPAESTPDGALPSRGRRHTGFVSSTAKTVSDICKGTWMIRPPRRQREYPDREIDCQEAMEPGFQAFVDCMLEAGWVRGEIMRSLRRLVAADNMTQKENAKVEAQLAIVRAMIRAGRPL